MYEDILRTLTDAQDQTRLALANHRLTHAKDHPDDRELREALVHIGQAMDRIRMAAR